MYCSGCWLSDPLNNYFGRRGTVGSSPPSFLAPSIDRNTDLLLRHLLLLFRHWICVHPKLATAFRDSSAVGGRHGQQGLDGPNLLRRKCARFDQGWLGNELAGRAPHPAYH
jgi:hypothetical protein